MKFALQRCCTTPVFLKQYETSTDAILAKLGIELVEIKEFGCCGYPFRNYGVRTYAACATRNLSLAEKNGLNIMTFCNCCYGGLKHADSLMKKDPALRRHTNETLGKEGLKYNGIVEVKHLLQVLYEDVGLEKIEGHIKRKYDGLNIGIHYGCHILRPRRTAQFADPGTASVFDQLVKITGAQTVPWRIQSECCGSPMLGIDNELSTDLTEKKIRDALQSGAQYLTMACPYCELQFDRVQRMLISKGNGNPTIPSILYTQLLGLALGIDAEVLGIDRNEVDISGILNFLS